jgi:phage-related protein
MQSTQIRREFGEALRDLQKGLSLGMPLSRPMPSVASGVHELRVKDATATIRVFYVTKIAHAIMVFHAFEKRTEKTPEREIKLAQQRLREMTP